MSAISNETRRRSGPRAARRRLMGAEFWRDLMDHGPLFWLRWLVVISVLPAWIVVAVTIWMGYEDRRATLVESILQRTHDVRSTVEQQLAAGIASLQILALSRPLATGDFADFHTQARDALAMMGGTAILLIDATGREIVNTIMPFGGPLPQSRLPEAVRNRVFETGKPVVSDLYIAGTIGRPVVAIAVPVVRGGEVAYALLLGFLPSNLAELINKAHELPPDWFVSILDGDGKIVARTFDVDERTGQQPAPAILNGLSGAESGTVETVSREGRPVLVGFSRLATSRWAVAFYVPLHELTGPLYRSLWLSVFGAGIVFVLAAFLPRFVTRRIEQSVRNDLTLAAEQQATLQTQLIQSQKMEAIGNLTGGMAHDFNNLLGIIIGNLDLLRELPAGDPLANELSGEALDAALRGAELTRRLLAFARRQPLKAERIEVNALVDGIASLLKRTLGEDITISLQLADDLWPISADPAQLEAALVNLAANARDAMPGGGSLTIATANRTLDADYAAQQDEVQPGDYVEIEVSDTGTGMPPAVAARIFEPFFTTKEQGKGTGLGLSMVFGFLKQSGGHVNVYSEPGIGTAFRLYLPRIAAPAEAPAAAGAPPITQGHGETVLAVEDNAGLRRVVVRQLSELGYRVVEAEDAQSALAMLNNIQVDLLFSDVVMPGETNGYQLACLARERWPGIKVLLTSGFAQGRANSVPTPGVPLLSKPYRRDDLARAVREVLES